MRNKVLFFVLFLRKRNVGLGFLKLKLVFLYYKVQTTALLPGSVQKNDPIHFSKLLSSTEGLLR